MSVITSAAPFAVVCLWFAISVICHAAGPTVWEKNVGPFFSRGVIWAPSDLTEPNLRSYYQRLSEELKTNLAWTVNVFVDREDASRELHGKLTAEGDYDWWLKLYNEFGRKLLPMAEILSFDGDAVLRLRDAHGACFETVLSGRNFLWVHQGSTDFQILDVHYRSLPPHTQSSPGDEAMIWVYVRSSVFPTVDEGKQLSELMRSRFHQKRIVVAIRTDSYFIADGAFPTVYRFDAEGTPPSRDDYANSRTMYCFCDRPEVRCR